MNGAMAGGVSAVFLGAVQSRWRRYLLDIPQLASGVLGGLVAVTAGAPVLRPWEGLLVGLIGGFVANGGKNLFKIIFRNQNHFYDILPNCSIENSKMQAGGHNMS